MRSKPHAAPQGRLQARRPSKLPALADHYARRVAVYLALTCKLARAPVHALHSQLAKPMPALVKVRLRIPAQPGATMAASAKSAAVGLSRDCQSAAVGAGPAKPSAAPTRPSAISGDAGQVQARLGCVRPNPNPNPNPMD